MEGVSVNAPAEGEPGQENGVPSPVNESIAHWARFLDECVRQRLETEKFQTFVALVQKSHRLPSRAIADLLLRPSSTNNVNLDPRIPLYMQTLGTMGYIDMPTILEAMYKYSSNHTLVESQQELAIKDGDQDLKDSEGKEKAHKPIRWVNSSWQEDHIFYALTKWVVEGRAIKDHRTALALIRILSKWMALFTAAAGAFAADFSGEVKKAQVEMESSRAGLVAVLLCIRENPVLLEAISKPMAKAARTELAQGLANFVPTLHLGTVTGKDILDKLEQFRSVTAASPEGDSKQAAADSAINDMLDPSLALAGFAVEELPLGTTRAGLYIYLSAMLCGRPLLDDAALFAYLTNRYHGDVQAAAIDLILAAFDILANAVFRSNLREDAQLLRSFLINKVPVLLSHLFTPGFPVEAAETCLSQALSQIDTNMFPTPSLIFDESRHNNPYTESSREEFCGACVLHGLVNREHVERILGEMSLGYEPKKYSKDYLVQQYLSQGDKIKSVVADLDKMDGSVGAVCQALVEVIRQLCNTRDTSSLKSLCTELVQKPQSLDIILLFEKLPAILEPLCQLLDKWRYEDDQAEYQPVYEEFGAILLLVLTMANRFNLSTADIGLYSPSSSVRKILNTAHLNRDMGNLSEQENQHLGGWIQGLFDTEGGGLGDDLMSSCPPQEFYLLVAPLFYNIVLGYSQGYISDDSLKSGVEYLVDTFLLPSLVPALKFLADFLWIDQDAQSAIIKILQLILLPSAISNEASSMLASVKKVIAKPLEHALRSFQKQQPKNEDIAPLLGSIKDSLAMSRRAGLSETNELEAWSTTSPSGFSSAVKLTVQGLIQWSSGWGMQHNSIPAAYSHRQIIAGIKLMTAKRVLNVILDEVHTITEQCKTQTIPATIQVEDMRLQAVYDVATAIICAPNVTNEPPAPSIEDPGVQGYVSGPPGGSRPFSLRDALRFEAMDFQRHEPAMAEIIVRLHRRVEAQMTIAQAPPMLQAPDMAAALDMTGNGDVSLGEAIAAMGSDAGLGLDMSGMDGLGGQSMVGSIGGDTSAGDDMFGIGGTGLGDFDWGPDMDLS